MKRNHPTLRLVFNRDDPRKYAQSTSGQRDSTATSRTDSRSMLIASDSEQGLQPYAMLERCPTVVSHRRAKVLRSSVGSASQKDLNVMTPRLHHQVIGRLSPYEEFTKWLPPPQTGCMNIEELKVIRRANLDRAIDLYLDGSQSELARRLNSQNPKPQYINDLLHNSKKSFGEKIARRIEEVIGLENGQLDIEDGPLVLQPNRRPKTQPRDLMAELTTSEAWKVQEFIAGLKKKRRKTAHE